MRPAVEAYAAEEKPVSVASYFVVGLLFAAAFSPAYAVAKVFHGFVSGFALMFDVAV